MPKTYSPREVTYEPFEGDAWGAKIYDAEDNTYLGSVRIDSSTGYPYGYIQPIDKMFVNPTAERVEDLLGAFRDPSCIW